MSATRVSRRTFIAGLTALGGAAALAACAPKAAPTAAPAAAPAAPQAATAVPKAPEGATLRFLAYQGRWGSHEVEFAKRYIEENKPKTKEVIIEEASYADAAKKIEAYFATGTMPDAGYLDTAFHPYLSYKGCFQAIDDLAASAGVDLSKRFNQKFYGKFTNGKSMAIGGPAGITPAMVVYNKTMAQERGVKLPHNDWTVEEFEEFCVGMTDKDKKVFGCAPYGFGGDHGTDGFFRRWGGRYLDETGTKCMFSDPKTQDGFKWQMRAIKEGWFASRTDVTEGTTKAFVTQVLGSMIGNAGWAGSAKEGVGDAFEYDYALLPQGPLCKGTSPCRGFAPYANAIWSSSQTKYPDLAFGMQARVTSAECSKWSVFNLGRQPGSDLSVWRDPEVLAVYPIWGKIADLMENPAGQFPMPANMRYLEYQDVGNAEYAKLGYGDVDYNEANVAAAENKVQVVLDLPMP